MKVFVTCTLTAIVVVYTAAYCRACGHRLLDMPGKLLLETKAVEDRPTGRGPVVKCRCKRMMEVIEHKVAA